MFFHHLRQEEIFIPPSDIVFPFPPKRAADKPGLEGAGKGLNAGALRVLLGTSLDLDLVPLWPR